MNSGSTAVHDAGHMNYLRIDNSIQISIHKVMFFTYTSYVIKKRVFYVKLHIRADRENR